MTDSINQFIIRTDAGSSGYNNVEYAPAPVVNKAHATPSIIQQYGS